MRFDVRPTARDCITELGGVWPSASDDMREALIDRWVMLCVQVAAVMDGSEPILPRELLRFRAALVQQLHDGVMIDGEWRALRFDYATAVR